MDRGPSPNKRRRLEDYGNRKVNRMIVELPPSRNRYVPNSGPPLQPIGLLPPDDSTAYIQERYILPPRKLARDGLPLPNQMMYLLGWTDLPAASQLVSAMEVLDWVSPLVLEQWEYKMELELDEAKKRLQKEKENIGQGQIQTRKKKRGRPPAHYDMQPAAVAVPEDEAQAKSRISKGAMSLTTPTKRQVAEDVHMWDDDDNEEQNSAAEMLIGGNAATLVGEVAMSDDEIGADSGGFMQVSGGAASSYGSESPSEPESRSISVSGGDASSSSRQAQTARPTLSSSRKAGTPRNDTVVNGQTKITSFLSANRATYKPPPSTHATPSQTPVPLAVHSSSSKIKASALKGKPKSTPKKPSKSSTARSAPAPAEPDSEFEIKRLEGMRLFDVEGQGIVRYFKVRWEGDWPADQNPTWEPEDFIPEAVIKQWFKLPIKRRGGSTGRDLSQKKKKTKQKRVVNAPRSVSEAFMGGVEDDYDEDDVGAQLANEMAMEEGRGSGVTTGSNWSNDSDEMQDELLVVADEGGQKVSSRRGLFPTALGSFRGFG